MGWLFSYFGGKDDLIAKFRAADFWLNGTKLLKDSVVGNNYWAVIEKPDGTRFIYLALMASGGKNSGWGYKDMSENAGPSEVNCPLSLLALAGEPRPDSYAVAWRGRVREYHAQKKVKTAEKKQLCCGAMVQFGQNLYKLLQPAAVRKGWIVEDTSTGARYRMSFRQLARAELAA